MLSYLKRNKILVVILIVASLLRFIGTNPGYSPYHPDEPIIYGAAINMVENNNLDPVRFDYPATEAFIDSLAFRYFFIPIQWMRYYALHIPEIFDGTVHLPISTLEKDVVFHTFILGKGGNNPMFWGRYVTAAFGVLSVFLLYLIGLKLFGKEVGLLAALFLSFDFKSVVNSHIGLPDVYNACFLLIALLAAINLWLKPNKKNYILAGLAAGLSFAGKYQFFGILPLLVSHLYISLDGTKINIRRFLNPIFIASGLCIPVVFGLFNPYFLVRLETALNWVIGVSIKYGVGANKINLFPFSYLYHVDFGPIEFVLFVLGLIFTTIKFPKKSLYLWVIILPFAYTFLYYSLGGFYVRNLITVTPILLLMAANFVWKIVSYRKIFLLLIPLVVFIPARNSILNSYFYTKPWNYGVLSEWLNNNISKDVIVGANPFDPPTGTPGFKKTEFELGGSYSLTEHKDDGDDYALLNMDWAGNSFYGWMNFGFDKVQKYWNKPIDDMRNTFFGIASEELFRYQVFSVIKPWQAPDADLVFAKLPVWPKVENNILTTLDFTSSDNGWRLIGSNLKNLNNKYLDLKGGSFYNFDIARITSPLINIKAGHLYQVRGDLKTASMLSARDRDGFLRIDFYGDNPDITKVGLISSVSSRVFGTTDWVNKIIIERAPDNAKYMTVSVGKDSSNNEVLLKNLMIEESKNIVEDITSSKPYIKKAIDLNDLYPNSHGNL